MPRGRRFGALILATVVATAAARASGPPPPRWYPGQRWTVAVQLAERTFGESLPGEVAPPGSRSFTERPSAPRLWHFEVAEMFESDDGGVRRHRVLVRRSGQDEPRAELIFVTRVKDGKPVARALQAIKVYESSGTFVRDLRAMAPEPIPGLVTGAELPLSYPYLAPDLPRKRTFTITEAVGELPFAMDVEQEILDGPAARTAARRLGVTVGERPVWVTRLRRPTDQQYTHQVWIEGDPWPVRAVANHAESTLLGSGAGG